MNKKIILLAVLTLTVGVSAVNAEQVWPVETDVGDTCDYGSPTTGEGAATYFEYPGGDTCGDWKEYSVDQGTPLVIHRHTDSGVLTDARYKILEDTDGDGNLEETYSNDNELGEDSEAAEVYTPQTNTIRIKNVGYNGFYVKVFDHDQRYPVETDVGDTCDYGSPTTGEGAATYFEYPGGDTCGDWKEYNVRNGAPLVIDRHTDSGVLTDARYKILEDTDGDGNLEETYSNDNELGEDSEAAEVYTPQTNTIRIKNVGYNGFYVKVFGPEASSGDTSLSVDASYTPEAPTTDDNVEIEGETDGTSADTITLYLDGSQVEECSSTTSCSYSAGTLSSGDHTYEATASKDGTTARTGSLTFPVESSGTLSVSVDHSPSSPTTDGEVTLEAETTIEADSISILQGGDEVNSCSSTSTCSAKVGPFSEGTYDYQATASAGGAATETSVQQFDVASDDDDGGGEDPPEPPAGDEEVSFDLNAGWNMISIPHGGLEVAAEEITDDCSLEKTSDGEYAYTYGGGYSQTSTFQGFEGYWVNVESSCTATYTADTYSETDSATELTDGWNMISPGNGEAESLDDIAGTCSFETSDGTAAYWYNPSEETYQTYSTSDSLEPNRGYWVNADGSCELDVTSVPPPPE